MAMRAKQGAAAKIATSQPTWGLEGEEVEFEDGNWDGSSGQVVKNPGKPKLVLIQVPKDKAWAVSGVLSVYREVSRLADEEDEPYYQHARTYTGHVLDKFFRPYLKGKEKSFIGLPSPLSRLWQASDYGRDLTNLSRGAPKAETAGGSSSRLVGRSFWSTDAVEKRISVLPEEFSHALDAVKARLRPVILPPQDIQMNDQEQGEDMATPGEDAPEEDAQMTSPEGEEEQRFGKKRVSRESLVREEEEPSRKRFKVDQQTEKPRENVTGAISGIKQTIVKQLKSFRENRSWAIDLDLIMSIQILLKWTSEEEWEGVVDEMLGVLREMAATEPADDADPGTVETIENSLPKLIALLEHMVQE